MSQQNLVESEWDFEITETVHADLDNDYGFTCNSKFTVVERFNNEDTPVYVLESLENGLEYEAYPIMISKIQT